MPKPLMTAVSKRACCLQGNQSVASQVLKLAQPLKAPDPVRRVARNGSGPSAFDKTSGAQIALTEALITMRQQARQQSELLARIEAKSQATLELIRELNPNFNDGQIAEEKLGAYEAHGSQPLPWLIAKDLAELRLDVAKRYLSQHQASRETGSPSQTNDTAQAFVSELPRNDRVLLVLQLTGGPTLHEVVDALVQRGVQLNFRDVADAVYEVQRQPLLPPLPHRGSPQPLKENTFYELRYWSRRDLFDQLKVAVHGYATGSPMQIRTSDGSRRLDLYRSGTERNSTTIIDQRDGSALGQPGGTNQAILDALGIKHNDYGALVISYGDSQPVMANEPSIYPSTVGRVQQGIDNWALSKARGSASPMGELLAMTRELLKKHGAPKPFRLGKNPEQSLDLVMGAQKKSKSLVVSGRPTGLPELDALHNDERLQTVFNTEKFLSWLSRSRADWESLVDVGNSHCEPGSFRSAPPRF